jgi:hypothetical protein
MRLPLHVTVDPIRKFPLLILSGKLNSNSNQRECFCSRVSTIGPVNLCRLRLARAIAGKYATATVKMERTHATIHVTAELN